MSKRHITAGITMLTLFENEIIAFAPFVLPQNNWAFDSGKTNGVMPAHVMRHCAASYNKQRAMEFACDRLEDLRV